MRVRESKKVPTLAVIEAATKRVQRDDYIRKLRRMGDRTQRRFELELAALFVELGHHVAGVAEEAGGLIVSDVEDFDGFTQPERDRVAIIVTSAALTEWGSRKIEPALVGFWERAAGEVFDLLDSSFDLGIDRDAAMRKVLMEGGRRMGLIDLARDTKRSLFLLLEDARQQGAGVKKVGKTKIAQRVPAGRFVHAGSRYRGQLIARTETLHAQRIAALEGYKRSPKVGEVIAYDGDMDPECAVRNGRTFTVGEAELETSLTHPNCVLAWGPLTGEGEITI